eukprot:178024-Alexandrium_andersonii.AAC.1
MGTVAQNASGYLLKPPLTERLSGQFLWLLSGQGALHAQHFWSGGIAHAATRLHVCECTAR